MMLLTSTRVSAATTSEMYFRHAWGVRYGLMTLNSLRPRTNVPAVFPGIHLPATKLPEPYLIAINPLKALDLWKAKPDLPVILQLGPLTKAVGAVAC